MNICDFVDFMANFAQFCEKEIYGDLLEYFETKFRRFWESAEKEKFVSLYKRSD